MKSKQKRSLPALRFMLLGLIVLGIGYAIRETVDAGIGVGIMLVGVLLAIGGELMLDLIGNWWD
jgi:cyanate permease